MKCSLFSMCPAKDQVVFERAKRQDLLKSYSVVNFTHMGDLNKILTKVKEKKPDHIIFDCFPKAQIETIIAALGKKMPGNKFEYFMYSADTLQPVQKPAALKEKLQNMLAVA